jgi:hypothetical protein
VEVEFLSPRTSANKDMKKNDKNKKLHCANILRKKLLPEPQPNSEPMLMGIASAPILQNPVLNKTLRVTYLSVSSK